MKAKKFPLLLKIIGLFDVLTQSHSFALVEVKCNINDFFAISGDLEQRGQI